MYSTCIYCKKPLGRNETLESFPVGHRIAFDPAKGRLWVVCRKCERWNLSPLEERWEAFEECERLFRATRMRMSTDEIGLARLADGLELVRIGAPLRPEFAAWRYGDQFGRRRRRALIWTGVGVAAMGAIAAGSLATGAGFGFIGNIPNLVLNIPTRAKVRTPDGRVLKFKLPQLKSTTVLASDESDLRLRIRHTKGTEVVSGGEARRIMTQLVPALNYMAGSRKTVSEAVDVIDSAGSPERYLAGWSQGVQGDIRKLRGTVTKPKKKREPGQPIHRLPTPTRLALEMALHEEEERRALAGELVELELAWREAEEIAAISDDLLVPRATREFIEEYRNDRVGAPAEDHET